MASGARTAGMAAQLAPGPHAAGPHAAGQAPEQTGTRWHVSSGVDLCAYAFSWVPIAIVMLLVPESSEYTFAIFIATTMVTDIHRHYTLPYIYLDREVRSRYPLRIWLLPAVFGLCLAVSPELHRGDRTLSVPQVAAVLACVWLGIQLMRQDRGGSFQLRTALPTALLPLLAAGLGTAIGVPGLDSGWLWLLAAAAASLLLHRWVSTDSSPQAPNDRRSPLVFPLGSLALAGAVLALPVGRGSVGVAVLVNLLFFVFLIWNGYHVILQKYGILRIYSAKSGRETKVPGWVDRFLVWSWFPLWVVWTAGHEFSSVLERLQTESPGLDAFVAPVLSYFADHFVLTMTLAASVAVAAAACFVTCEWKVNRFQNAPRLGFALGTVVFYATFFPLGIVYFYSAYAFTHGIEYMVFTWAFQRRRYGSVREGAPMLSRWLRQPLLFYATYTGVLFAGIFYARYAGIHFFVGSSVPEAFGVTLWDWVRWYTLYQAMLHFYYDGFLWKLRRPELRAQL